MPFLNCKPQKLQVKVFKTNHAVAIVTYCDNNVVSINWGVLLHHYCRTSDKECL